MTDHEQSTLATSATSTIAETKDVSVLQNGPFFTKLNHDVRLIIYDYLYMCLPPLAHKQERYDKPGMILSCKQANLVRHNPSPKIECG